MPQRACATARICWRCSCLESLGSGAGFSGSGCSQQQAITSSPPKTESLSAQPHGHALRDRPLLCALTWHSPPAALAQRMTVSPGTDCISSERTRMRRMRLDIATFLLPANRDLRFTLIPDDIGPNVAEHHVSRSNYELACSPSRCVTPRSPKMRFPVAARKEGSAVFRMAVDSCGSGSIGPPLRIRRSEESEFGWRRQLHIRSVASAIARQSAS